MTSISKSAGCGSRPTTLKSGVWEHFVRDGDKQTAQCKKCKASLKIGGGSTKSLHNHLQTKHSINVLKGKPSADLGSDEEGNGDNNVTDVVKPNMHKNSRSTLASGSLMMKYVLKPNESSLAATVARLTACDGLSFNVFSTSNDLRRVFAAAGYSDIPKSANGISALVSGHGQAVRSYVMTELAERKASGQKFSITFDEWTSTRNRRYMIVNVHEQGPKFWSLGLVRVYGSMPAEKCIELLETKLATFGLSLSKDIVAICTDGASVMCKVGKLIEAEQQLCYAHGIQLAVLDVLYKHKFNKRMDSDYASDNVTHRLARDGDGDAEMVESQLLEADNHQLEGEEDSEEPDGDLNVDLCLEVEEIQDDNDAVPELSDDYEEVISKVRKVVKIFRKSPTKNDAILQKYVREEHGKDLSLMLDCPTRWNSLLAMLSRFQQLASCVQKALIDLKLSNEVTQTDFGVINEMVETLQPVALAVEAICRRDVNLIAAEAAIQFCIVQLRRQSSELANIMAASLQQRMHERMATHSGVLHYLHNRHESSMISPVPQASVIRQFIQRLVARLDQVHEGNSKDGLIRFYATLTINVLPFILIDYRLHNYT
jgi:hypothetical protein